MFTVKLYRDGKTRVYEAGSVTILHGVERHELTLHDVPGSDDFRVDITMEPDPPDVADFHWLSAIIENANGKTSEVLRPAPSLLAA